MSSESILTLLTVPGAKHFETLLDEWAELGIRVLPADDAREEAASEIGTAKGVVLTERPREPLPLFKATGEAGDEPRLLLVYGECIPYGAADELTAAYPHPMWEVVRLYRFADKRKVLIGGDPGGFWLRALCRHAARRGIISLACRRREVDEAVRQLSLYLSWKERFYMRMSDRCDRMGVRGRVVAQAIGMDKRIGQGWLHPMRKQHGPFYRWIRRQLQQLAENVDVHRITLWGRPDFWSGLPAAGLWDKDTEIRLFSPDPMAGTEQLPRTWRVHTHWLPALDQSDLLIIGTPDPLIQEIRLPELVKGMAKPIILDACSCFPLEETACCQIIYRTIGENTNVWEWN